MKRIEIYIGLSVFALSAKSQVKGATVFPAFNPPPRSD